MHLVFLHSHSLTYTCQGVIGWLLQTLVLDFLAMIEPRRSFGSNFWPKLHLQLCIFLFVIFTDKRAFDWKFHLLFCKYVVDFFLTFYLLKKIEIFSLYTSVMVIEVALLMKEISFSFSFTKCYTHLQNSSVAFLLVCKVVLMVNLCK